jgi:hypothetical protein
MSNAKAYFATARNFEELGSLATEYTSLIGWDKDSMKSFSERFYELERGVAPGKHVQRLEGVPEWRQRRGGRDA